MLSPSSPVFGPATVTSADFVAFLVAKGSPAAAEGARIYAVFTAAGIDPCVALGQFGAESSFGKAGYATVTKNWGNILYYTWTANMGATPWAPGNGYTYSVCASWTMGAQLYAALMTSYRTWGWAGSITTMASHWLGSSSTSYVNNIVTLGNSVTAAVPVSGTLSHFPGGPIYRYPTILQAGRLVVGYGAVPPGDYRFMPVNLRWGAQFPNPWYKFVNNTGTAATYNGYLVPRGILTPVK